MKSFLILCLCFLATQGLLISDGIMPASPVKFLVGVSLVYLPLAYVLTTAAERLSRPAAYGLPCGLLLLILPLPPGLRLVGVVALLIFTLRGVWRDRLGLKLAGAVATLFVGFAFVRNINYLGARLLTSPLHDPAFAAFDLSVFSALAGHALSPAGLYPLVDNPFLVEVLSRAYGMLFVELFVVVLMFARRGDDPARFYAAMFGCYALSVVVFIVYPVFGPVVYNLQTFSPALRDNVTYQISQAIATEFEAIRTTGPVNGMGYFVAFPSLHVAMATLFQLTLRPALPLFWTFLPINAALIVSTVVLGHHYLADVPSGIALAVAAHAITSKLFVSLREKVSQEASSPVATCATPSNG